MPVRQRDHAADDDDAAAAAHTRPPKRCKHCDESSQAVGGGAGGAGGECGGGGGCWRVTLDRDLVDTLSAIYPEWFKPQTHNTHLNRRTGVSQEEASGSEEECARMSAGSGGSSPPAPAHPSAPPAAPALDAFAAFAAHPAHLAHAHNAHNAHAVYALAPDAPHVVVDASPLQQAMDKNKESLKVKLMLRRPLNQLVAQGIMPPLKSPPAFHEQRRQLERAKTGDLLKAKIQRRPDRQELERRHILERQEGHVDPSLAEKQRMLKKARLADQLNDQLSHRPGPLELIQKNILHTEEPIEIAVKQGLVAFKATSEGALRRPEHPHSYRGPDDDSPTPSPPSPAATSASFSTLSPASSAASASPRADRPPLTAPPAPPQPPPAPPAPHAPHAPHPPPAPHAPQPPHALLVHQTVSKDRNRKKSKSKSTPKARTIKFHEYKGPPNAHKSSSPPLIDGETSYELLLRQQQLFLQWQLESQHKYPQILFPAKARCAPTASMSSPSPAASVASAASVCSEASDSSPRRPPSPASPAAPPPPPPLPLRLEDMKVSDLKAELKRRSLTVSGSKPHLIERLRAFAAERAPPTPDDRDRDAKSEAPSSPASAAGSPDAHSDLESQPATPQPQPAEDIVRSQRRRIEELQRELQRSQRQLEAVKREAAPAPAPARRLALHHLQAKIHSHQLAAHIQHLQTLQAAAERRAPAAAPPPLPPIAPALPPPARAPPVPLPLAVPVRLPTRYVLAAEPSAERLLRLVPAGDGLKMQFEGLEGFDGDENVGLVLNGVKVVPVTLVPSEPPPRYEEAARAVAASPPAPPPPPPPPPPLPSRSPPVKSEIVDDVLEILIKNGELPASAANLAQDACDGPDFGADDSSPLAGRDALRDDFDVIESELLDSISEKGAIDADRYSDFIMRARDESEYLNGDEPMDEGDRIDDGDLLDDLIRENSERRDFDEAPYLCFHERAPAAEEEATGRPRPSPPWPGRCEGLDLKELGLELESPGPSWPGRAEPEPMDTDEWLEALWPRQPQCDPLLGGAALLPAPRPQRPHFSWDRIDFAAT